METHYPHGLILRDLLDKARISNKDFAKKINKSEPSLSNYMNQYTIAFNTLSELARALDVDVSTFDRPMGNDNMINFGNIIREELVYSNHSIVADLKQRIRDLESIIELQKKYIARLESDAK